MTFVRAFIASAAVVAIGVLVAFQFTPPHTYQFIHLRVVNDTRRTVKIQPCWDLNCVNTVGLSQTVVPRGTARGVDGTWTNDQFLRVVVAVLKPDATGTGRPFEGCVIQVFPPGHTVGVLRVSNEAPCLNIAGDGVGAG